MGVERGNKMDDILNDPAASDWLKRSLVRLEQRDPVDALNDLEVLIERQRERLNTITLPWGSGVGGAKR
jgi:uncharacterized protein (DUF2384 family)